MIDILSTDILNYILTFLDIYSQISLVNICKRFKTKIKIKNLDVPFKYSKRVTNDILKKYPYIEELSIYDNKLITDLNDYKFIRKLNINNCRIGFDGIKHLSNIIELDITNNLNYFDLRVFTRLEILNLRGLSNITVQHLNEIPTLKIVYARRSNVQKDIIDILDKRIKLVL